jgi:FKBP-type peptidyl-prolyl cis-trans isomerase FkpA
MKTRIIVLLLTFLSVIWILSSCLKTDDNSDYEQRLQVELDTLKAYITRNNITIEPQSSGLYYLEQVKGTGDSAELYNYVTINYVGYQLNGKMFDTNVDTMAVIGGIYNANRTYEPLRFQLGYSNIIAGVQEGVAYMKEGGMARVIFPSYLGYGQYSNGTIPGFSSLIFDLHLIKVEEY